MTRSMILADWQVRAALEGRLTQVRLPVVPQPPLGEWGVSQPWETSAFQVGPRFGNYNECREYRSPYAVGDMIIVKETWRTEELLNGQDGILFQADDFFQPIENTVSAADAWIEANATSHGHWRSPVTMPHWASRLSFVVTGVKVERVQEISEQDAVACGFTGKSCNCQSCMKDRVIEPHILAFSLQWILDNSRYASRGYGWEDNVWCWVYTLEGVQHATSDL